MIYLASFKGTHPGWKGWFSSLIKWVTKSQYSHTETCVGNPFESAVLCVSSVGTEGGVRGKVMRLDPKYWDILPMPWVTEGDVITFLAEHKGEGYDVIGCVRSVLPFVSREHSTKWFCSETSASIQKISEAWRFPPGDMHVVVESRGLK